MRVRDWDYGIVDQKSDLLGLFPGRAGHDLCNKVGGERHDLAGDEAVEMLIANGVVECWTFEEGGEVEGREGV